MPRPPRPDYGIDAPELVRFFLASGAAAVVLASMAPLLLRDYTVTISIVTSVLGLAACYLLGMGGFMIYESRIGKVSGRDTILDQVDWRGDEIVLDVGCGRGLLLVGTALRLETGRAIGVDIWQAKDQSGNSRDGAAHNAAIEGVSDRIDIQTADMRALPFSDVSFDVVMSHWVVHNLDLETDRNIALTEMARVLRAGGTLIITDIENRSAYARYLRELGFDEIRLLVNPIKDFVLTVVSFGTFRPATIVASKPNARGQTFAVPTPAAPAQLPARPS